MLLVYVVKPPSVATGIAGNETPGMTFRVYPNPNSGLFQLELNSGDKAAIIIYDVMGKVIYRNITESPASTVDLAEVPGGLYFVKVVAGNRSETKKLIINR
jgi:hypothetical protein